MKSGAQPTPWLDELPEEALTILAHELRTPVQIITGWALLLQREPSSQTKRCVLSRRLFARQGCRRA